MADETVAFEIPAELTEKFGFKTIEEIEATVNKAKTADDFVAKETEFTTKENAYKTQVDELNGKVNAYEGNTFLKEIATVVTNNPDKLDTYLSLRNVNDATTGKDAFALRMKLEKGWTDEDINDELKAKFGVMPDYAEEIEVQEYNRRIERNFTEHKDWLKEQKQKLVFVAPKQEYTPLTDEQIAATTEQAFTPIKEQKDFYKAQAAITPEEWKEWGADEGLKIETPVEILFDAERQNRAKQLLSNFVKQNNLQNLSKENLDSINKLLFLGLKGENYERDLSHAIKENTRQVEKQVREYYQKKYSIGTPRTPPTKTTSTVPFSVKSSTEPPKFVTPNKK